MKKSVNIFCCLAPYIQYIRLNKYVAINIAILASLVLVRIQPGLTVPRTAKVICTAKMRNFFYFNVATFITTIRIRCLENLFYNFFFVDNNLFCLDGIIKVNITCNSMLQIRSLIFKILTRELLEACFARDMTLMTHILYRYMVVLIIVFIQLYAFMCSLLCYFMCGIQ